MHVYTEVGYLVENMEGGDRGQAFENGQHPYYPIAPENYNSREEGPHSD